MKVVTIAVLFILSFFGSALSQTRVPDAAREGLVGRVRSVRIEVASFTKKSGRWDEGKRAFQRELAYDVDGDISEEVNKDRNTGLLNRHQYTYEKNGHRLERVQPSSLGEGSVSVRSELTLSHAGPAGDY